MESETEVDFTYWINYQRHGEDEWYQAGFDEMKSLSEAQELANDFLTGKKHPKAGRERPGIARVEILQVVTTSSVIWSAA